MRLWSLIRCDMRLQLRHGYYAAYVFIGIFYVALLRALPLPIRSVALPPVLLSEAAVVGFFFAGTLLHLERSAGTLDALGMTPVRPREYLLARALSLALLTGAVGIVIGAGAVRIAAPLLLTAATVLIGTVFVFSGLAVAARFQGLERFVVWGGLGTAVFGLPVLPHLGLLPSPLWALLPTHPALLLFAASVGDAPGAIGSPDQPLLVPLSMLALLGWVAISFLLAHRWITRYTPGWGGAIR